MRATSVTRTMLRCELRSANRFYTGIMGGALGCGGYGPAWRPQPLQR